MPPVYMLPSPCSATDLALAARWPPYLNPIYRNARGVRDPDRWHLDLKRGETPPVGVADDRNYNKPGGERPDSQLSSDGQPGKVMSIIGNPACCYLSIKNECLI